MPRGGVEQRIRMECHREQPQRSVRDPASAAGEQDGVGRSGLADERAHPDQLGPRLHRRAIRHVLRCMGAYPGDRPGTSVPSSGSFDDGRSRRVRMTFTEICEVSSRTSRQTGHFARAPPRLRNVEQRLVSRQHHEPPRESYAEPVFFPQQHLPTRPQRTARRQPPGMRPPLTGAAALSSPQAPSSPSAPSSAAVSRCSRRSPRRTRASPPPPS